MKRDSDQELINMALNQEQKAYSRLLSRYKDNIYFYILKMIGNKTSANDLTLETFDKAFQKLDTYNNEYAFSTWLYKIARNKTIDYVRKRKLNTISINYGADEEASINENTLQSGVPNPEENMIRLQEETKVMEYINAMKPKYRKLIELRFIKEYAYEEIAQKLNIPIGTVKTQLFRAKNILAEMMIGTIDD